jgi:hypothetical protein
MSGTSNELNAAVNAFTNELQKIRTGGASPSLLDSITLTMGGEQVPLLGVAQVAVKDSNTLVVTTFDVNDAGAVEQAIRESDLGLEPARDGKLVRVGQCTRLMAAAVGGLGCVLGRGERGGKSAHFIAGVLCACVCMYAVPPTARSRVRLSVERNR